MLISKEPLNQQFTWEKQKKSGFLVKFYSYYLSHSLCENYKTHKWREILHFQKHSPLCNQFWKAAMFFIFVIFHFLCKLIILSSPLSVNKSKILKNFYWFFLVYDNDTWYFVLFECKFCNEIFIMIYYNDLSYVIFHFDSHKIYYFDPCWNAKCCLRMLAVIHHPPKFYHFDIRTRFLGWLLCFECIDFIQGNKNLNENYFF